MESDIATDCDHCHGGIGYNELAYASPQGYDHDGCPVVRIFCADCYGKGNR
jgi:hypothetical protein